MDEFAALRLTVSRARYWLSQALAHEKKSDEAREDPGRDPAELAPYLLRPARGAILGLTPIDGSISDDIPMASDGDPYLLPQEGPIAFAAGRSSWPRAPRTSRRSSSGSCTRATRAFEPLSRLTSRCCRPGREATTPPFPACRTKLIARGTRDAFSTYLVGTIFPVAQWELIRKSAQENHIDPIVVMSLTKQESSFDASAVSPVGALGLMQLMPATASEMMPDQARADLVKADVNIKTGTKYLGKLLARFNGNIALAVAAYNAGPGAVNRWLKAAGPGAGLLDFIEAIPFKETREYVAAIIRNYFWYARKLDPDAYKRLTLAYFWGDTHAAPDTPDAPDEDAPDPVPEAPKSDASRGKLAVAPGKGPVLPASMPSPTPKLPCTAPVVSFPPTGEFFGPDTLERNPQPGAPTATPSD